MAHKATPYTPSSADLAAVALSGSATDLGSGTLAAARMPALTGDVTTSAGAVATAIGANKVVTSMILDANVTLAKLANLAQSTVVGRNTASTGVPEAVTMAQLAALLGFTGSAWTTDSAGANTQNLASTAVISGTNQDYEVSGKILTANTTVSYGLEPNSLATNQECRLYGSDGTNPIAEGHTFIVIGEVASTATIYFSGRISQATGVERLFILEVMVVVGAAFYGYTTVTRWNVTSEITALRIHCTGSTHILTGSSLRVRKV